MTTITFDTEAFKDAQGEAEIATQHDIKDIRRDIDDLRRDMDARLALLEQRLTIKLGSLMALSIGIVAALDKLL